MTRRCRHGLQTDWCWGNSGWGLETRDLDWEIGRHQRLCLSYRPCPIRPYGAPSPRGEGCDTKIPLSPSNPRPFGAPPSIGRREYPRKPLPLEGKADDTRETCHSQTFGHRPINICGEAATTTLNPEPSGPVEPAEPFDSIKGECIPCFIWLFFHSSAVRSHG